MKEYKLPLDSFIGGWFLPTKVCDELVSYYNEFNKHATPGKSGGGKIRKNIKSHRTKYKLKSKLRDFPISSICL